MIPLMGSTEKIESDLVRHLSAKGTKVRARVLDPQKGLALEAPGFEIVHGDLGDPAVVSCYGTATHDDPDEQKRLTYFFGSYDFDLTRTPSGWKVDGFRFNKKHVE